MPSRRGLHRPARGLRRGARCASRSPRARAGWPWRAWSWASARGAWSTRAAGVGEDYLLATLDTDPGARRLGRARHRHQRRHRPARRGDPVRREDRRHRPPRARRAPIPRRAATNESAVHWDLIVRPAPRRAPERGRRGSSGERGVLRGRLAAVSGRCARSACSPSCCRSTRRPSPSRSSANARDDPRRRPSPCGGASGRGSGRASGSRLWPQPTYGFSTRVDVDGEAVGVVGPRAGAAAAGARRRAPPGGTRTSR